MGSDELDLLLWRMGTQRTFSNVRYSDVRYDVRYIDQYSFALRTLSSAPNTCHFDNSQCTHQRNHFFTNIRWWAMPEDSNETGITYGAAKSCKFNSMQPSFKIFGSNSNTSIPGSQIRKKFIKKDMKSLIAALAYSNSHV